MTKQNKYIMIYRMDLAMELIGLGHKVFQTCPNPQKSNLTAWIFEKDETFEEDFNRLLGKE
jgi:hypothetical protein